MKKYSNPHEYKLGHKVKYKFIMYTPIAYESKLCHMKKYSNPHEYKLGHKVKYKFIMYTPIAYESKLCREKNTPTLMSINWGTKYI
jgi:ribosomal protein L32